MGLRYSELLELAHREPAVRADLVPVLRRYAMEFPTERALKQYLKEHPGADRRNHSVAEHAQKWRPSKGVFNKVFSSLKNFVVGKAHGIRNTAKKIRGFFKKKDVATHVKRAATGTALRAYLGPLVSTAVMALAPGLGGVALLGLKAAVSVAVTKTSHRVAEKLFPSKGEEKAKTAAEKKAPSSKQITEWVQEEFEKALREEMEQFKPSEEKSGSH